MSAAQARPTVRMADDELWRFVRDAHTAIFVTLRGDGMPVALPVWFAAVSGRIYVWTGGSKIDRIAREPRAAVLVESGERWTDLKAVHFTGRATVLDEGASTIGSAIAEEFQRKYSAYRVSGEAMPAATRDAYARAGRRLVEFVPDARVLNWDNSKLALGGYSP